MNRNIVSISNNTDIRQGWRVRAFAYDERDWNSLARTLAERRNIKTERAARKYAAELAAAYQAEIRG